MKTRSMHLITKLCNDEIDEYAFVFYNHIIYLENERIKNETIVELDEEEDSQSGSSNSNRSSNSSNNSKSSSSNSNSKSNSNSESKKSIADAKVIINSISPAESSRELNNENTIRIKEEFLSKYNTNSNLKKSSPDNNSTKKLNNGNNLPILNSLFKKSPNINNNILNSENKNDYTQTIQSNTSLFHVNK
jgi:hypothetical protein